MKSYSEKPENLTKEKKKKKRRKPTGDKCTVNMGRSMIVRGLATGTGDQVSKEEVLKRFCYRRAWMVIYNVIEVMR